MIRCCAGHQPLAMYGRQRKGHTYMTCDYGRAYGREAAEQIDGHGQWLSIREDQLLPIVEQFFAERIFGPMRLDKLARQLRAHEKTTSKQTTARHGQLRDAIADIDRRVALQIEAVEAGVEPDLVKQRIAKLRADKEKAEIELGALPPAQGDQKPAVSLEDVLERIPDLTQLLRDAPPEIKRQVFDAFGLQVTYDKTTDRTQISAAITEALADALERDGGLPADLRGLEEPDATRLVHTVRPKRQPARSTRAS